MSGERAAARVTESGPRTHRWALRSEMWVAHRAPNYDPAMGCGDMPGDGGRYPQRFASYSKGLPHERLGEVDPHAYAPMLFALERGRGFAAVPRGASRAFANPRARRTFSLEGIDEMAVGGGIAEHR